MSEFMKSGVYGKFKAFFLPNFSRYSDPVRWSKYKTRLIGWNNENLISGKESVSTMPQLSFRNPAARS